MSKQLSQTQKALDNLISSQHPAAETSRSKSRQPAKSLHTTTAMFYVAPRGIEPEQGGRMLTPDEAAEYEKASVASVFRCANCDKSLHPFETHVCDECARLLLEGEVTERVRSEGNG